MILEAASLEFRANGYASTTMSAVGQRAGVSTKTMYRLIPTKADLFKSMCSDRIGRFMLAIDETIVGTLELEAALERILGGYGNLALDGEVIAITRLVTSESDRFPNSGRLFTRAPSGAPGRPSRAGCGGNATRVCSRSMIPVSPPICCAA